MKIGDKFTTTLAVADSETGVVTTYVVRTTLAEAVASWPGEPGTSPSRLVIRWTRGTARLTDDAMTTTITIQGSSWGRYFDEEHLTWIRGWPELDSPEVKALLVAVAMGPGAIPKHELATLESGDVGFTGYTFDLGLQR